MAKPADSHMNETERAALRASVQQSRKDDSQRKWGRGRATKPGEVEGNLRAAQQLIPPQEWAEAEKAFPVDLDRIAESLNLPVDAVIWRARAEEVSDGEGKVHLHEEALALLAKPATGTGGIQSLLRKLQANLEGEVLTLRRKEFMRMREYLVNLKGGIGIRLRAVADCTRQAIQNTGGLGPFFAGEVTAVSAVAVPKAAPAAPVAKEKAIKEKPKSKNQIDWQLPKFSSRC